MFRLMQLLGRDKTNAAAQGEDGLQSGAALLVITRDSDFYAGISEIVSGGNGPLASSRKSFFVPIMAVRLLAAIQSSSTMRFGKRQLEGGFREPESH